LQELLSDIVLPRLVASRMLIEDPNRAKLRTVNAEPRLANDNTEQQELNLANDRTLIADPNCPALMTERLNVEPKLLHP
jgi:hypothetical protein